MSGVNGNARITAVRSETVAREVLARAAVKVGGVGKLASHLNLSSRALSEYVNGRLAVPDALFLRVLDVVLEELPESERDH